MPINLSNRQQYNFNSKSEIFLTPELRALKMPMTDPLILNFKLMIDYNKPYGLFADESNVNSALAYLKRIGQLSRYELLKKWISLFKTFVNKYDFLILNCVGLDEILTLNQSHFYNEQHKIAFQIREISDMFVQSLITMYREIWFDNKRKVEILPANLRRFDFSILIYSAGYYNMFLYDIIDDNDLTDSDIKTKIYPTIKKLSENYFIDNGKYDFNHHLVVVGDAEINLEESGKSFFETMTNEMNSDMVKNTLSFNFRFANYKGVFNNVFGEFDIVKLLAVSAANDRIRNQINQPDNSATIINNGSTNKDGNFIDNLKTSLKTKRSKYIKHLTENASFIGNAFQSLNSANKTTSNIIKQAVNKGLSEFENRIIGSSLAKINNLVSRNFSDTFNGIYNRYLKKENSNKTEYSTNKTPTSDLKNIKYENSNTNIFNRNSF